MSTSFWEKVDINEKAYYTDNVTIQEELSWTIKLRCIRKWC